jgi:transposase-like protein
MSVLAEPKTRGITEVLICCCDGLAGLQDCAPSPTVTTAELSDPNPRIRW